MFQTGFDRKEVSIMSTSMFYGELVSSDRIIYTPSDFAKMNLLYLQETGTLKAQKPHTSSRSNLNSYLFFMVMEGSGTLTYDNIDYQLQPGFCGFIDCYNQYAHQSSDDLWTLKWAHFNGSNMKAIYQKYLERGGLPCFDSHHFSEYEEILTELFQVASSSSYIKDMQIFEKLTSLLTLLMEESWNPSRKAGNGIQSHAKKHDLLTIKDYLDLHFAEKIALNDLAHMFYINKFYLTRVFKEQFGVTINGYLIQLRITKAKQLLRFSDKTVDEISMECGYDDSNYFSRLFKKVEGISPSEYRVQW